MIKYLRLWSLTLASIAAFSGCHSIDLDSKGDMVAVYQFGEFRMLVNTTAPMTARATQMALRQLDLYQTNGALNKFEAQFIARARDDQKVTVSISEVNSRQTLVRIRWGERGNLALSRRLFEQIDRNVQ